MKNFIRVGMLSVALSTLGMAPTALAAPNPYARANNSFISISGKVDSVSPDAFMLNYGDGVVKVEMDDRQRDADGYKLMKGDKVRVTGFIDDDVFETTKIEAGSVFVENLGTYFFASAADEEDDFVTIVAPVSVSATVVQGKVTGVNGRRFTVDSGSRQVTVDTSGLGYNPLDDEGYQKIKKGDRVSVGGKMDKNFWGKRELKADSVVTLSPSSGKASASENKGKSGSARTSDTAAASNTNRNAATK